MKLPQSGPQGPFSQWPNFAVAIEQPGRLDTLQVRPAARRAPGYGEIEIEVQSVALHYQQAMQALGILPAPAGGPSFGRECSGVILEVGPDVVGLEPGMEVIALHESCLSGRVTVSAAAAVRKPAHLPWEQAAGLGISFMTAYYALQRLGRLRAGESVLILNATEGVGLAAIQVAQWLGAEIYTTVRTPAQREYLQGLGMEHIFDAESPTFASELMEHSGQHGVDVVLNSLGGEFIAKSLQLLAPFGRFLELGRRDVNALLPLSLLEKGVGFFVVNLSLSTPGFHEMLPEVLNLVDEGTFRPLPCRYFSLRRLEEALSLLASAESIGKVVINLPTRNAAASVDSMPPIHLTPEPDAGSRRPMLTEGLLSSEGLDVFRRVLAGNSPQVVVSTRSLDTRLVQTEDLVLPQLDEDHDSAARPGYARRDSGSAYVPPRNDLEGTICGIWEKFFRIKLIGINDNFFDIGGDSLLAVQLTSRLREVAGVELSPHSLLETPTIAGLAEAIARLNASSPLIRAQRIELPRCMVKIKGGDPSLPLFLIHPAGGHVFHYLALAHTVATAHEVYGIKSEQLEANPLPLHTLEAMARHYNAEVRKLQPRGPYVLGGASFGGALAYEMAQQLVTDGHEVGLLFLIDTADPAALTTDEVEDAELLSYNLKLAFDISDSLDDLRQLLPDEQIRYFLERAKKANKQFPAVSFVEAQQLLHPLRANLKALAHYRPRPYPGRLIYFQSMEQVEDSDTTDPPWPKLALGGSIMWPVPGNHITMNFMPHVQVLGDKLSQLLLEMPAPANRSSSQPLLLGSSTRS